MRVPRAVARFNRRVTNKAVMATAGWLPTMGVLHHVGRKSGKNYRTPLLLFNTRTGYAVVIGYGPQTDWVKNVLAQNDGTSVRKHGRTASVGSPTLVSKTEATPLVTPASRMLFRVFPYNERVLLLTKV